MVNRKSFSMFFMISLLLFGSLLLLGQNVGGNQKKENTVAKSDCCIRWKQGKPLQGCSLEEITLCKKNWIEEQLQKNKQPIQPSLKQLNLKKAVLVSY